MKKLIREYMVDENELSEQEKYELCNNYNKNNSVIKYDKDERIEVNTTFENQILDIVQDLDNIRKSKPQEFKDGIKKLLTYTKRTNDPHVYKLIIDYLSNNVVTQETPQVTNIPLDTFLTVNELSDAYDIYQDILDKTVAFLSPDTLEGTRQIENFINNDLDFYYDLFSNDQYIKIYKAMFIKCAELDKPTGETISDKIKEYCKDMIRIPGQPFNNPKDRFGKKFLKEITVNNLIGISNTELKNELEKHKIDEHKISVSTLTANEHNSDNDNKGNIYGKTWYVNGNKDKFEYFLDGDISNNKIYIYEPFFGISFDEEGKEIPNGISIVTQNTQLDNVKGDFEKKYAKELEEINTETHSFIVQNSLQK